MQKAIRPYQVSCCDPEFSAASLLKSFFYFVLSNGRTTNTVPNLLAHQQVGRNSPQGPRVRLWVKIGYNLYWSTTNEESYRKAVSLVRDLLSARRMSFCVLLIVCA